MTLTSLPGLLTLAVLVCGAGLLLWGKRWPRDDAEWGDDPADGGL